MYHNFETLCWPLEEGNHNTSHVHDLDGDDDVDKDDDHDDHDDDDHNDVDKYDDHNPTRMPNG